MVDLNTYKFNSWHFGNPDEVPHVINEMLKYSSLPPKIISLQIFGLISFKEGNY